MKFDRLDEFTWARTLNIYYIIDDTTLNNNTLNYFFEQNEFLRTKNFESNLIKYNYLQSIILVSRNDINYFSFKRNLNNNNYIPIFESGIGVQPIRINAKEINVNYKKNLGNLLFFGTLSYEPNKVAIDFLLNNLLPILKANKVKFKLTIAGRNPSRNLLKNIEIYEEVYLVPNPKNMNQIIDNSFLSLVPIFTGSGQQYKAVESLSRGTPIIISSQAADALSLQDGVNCLIADNSQEYYKCLDNLMNSPYLYKQLAMNGLNYIDKEFSWKSRVDNLIKNIYKF